MTIQATGQTAYEARFGADKLGPKGDAPAWESLGADAHAVWARVEAACLASALTPSAAVAPAGEWTSDRVYEENPTPTEAPRSETARPVDEDALPQIAWFDEAYRKACETSDPQHWMEAALLGQQLRNATLKALATPTQPAAGPSQWKCAAKGNVGANDPQECDWPMCGCDPHSDKVIAALQESGHLQPTQPAAGQGAGDAFESGRRTGLEEAAQIADQLTFAASVATRVRALAQATLTPSTSKAAPLSDEAEVIQHIKSGGRYEVVTRDAQLQTAEPLGDHAFVAVYRNVITGATWVRPLSEMDDGRFRVIKAPTPADDTAREGK